MDMCCLWCFSKKNFPFPTFFILLSNCNKVLLASLFCLKTMRTIFKGVLTKHMTDLNASGPNAYFFNLHVLHSWLRMSIYFSQELFFQLMPSRITRSNSQKASEPWLCGFDRVRWKMKNCILSFGFPGQVFWSP
jgi:hypothetical protein